MSIINQSFKKASVDDDARVAVLKGARPDVSVRDMADVALTYIDDHSYLGSRQKASAENFFSAESISVEKGADSVFVIMQRFADAEKFAKGLSAENKGMFTCEITSGRRIKDEIVHDQPYDEPKPEPEGLHV